MDAPQLEISPMELKFRFELKKQIPTTLRLVNPGDKAVAFKVKTTSPKKYCVRPNVGTVPPNATTLVQIIMQAQKEYPTDLNNCKDKFLVQSANVPAGSETKDISELFAKGAKNISESKLKVLYEQPPPPPSPITEEPVSTSAVMEEEPAVSAAGDKSSSTRFESTKADLVMVTKEKNAAEMERARLATQVADLMSQLDGARAELVKSTMPSTPSAAVATKQQRTSTGFSLLHILLTAIFAFIIGRFT